MSEPEIITPATQRRQALAALTKAQAALNPLSGFLRKQTSKRERYLESLREEIRRAIRELEAK